MQEQVKLIVERYRGEWNSKANRFDFPCFYKTEEAKQALGNLLGDQVKIIDGDSGEFQPWIRLEGFEYDPNYGSTSAREVPTGASI